MFQPQVNSTAFSLSTETYRQPFISQRIETKYFPAGFGLMVAEGIFPLTSQYFANFTQLNFFPSTSMVGRPALDDYIDSYWTGSDSSCF
jgi:hypothetical protein